MSAPQRLTNIRFFLHFKPGGIFPRAVADDSKIAFTSKSTPGLCKKRAQLNEIFRRYACRASMRVKMS